ncbi:MULTISPECIES: DUF5691 domain-containing protein [Massilia]|uniref:Uncharacterized protein n=2 Tax=Massilia TaxID=149698 RepID=A0A7X3G8A9_9BURK|nr:DUF5691 domain-containing protein [Telluria cellulosilytica]MDN4046772.1 DUF5691 domain-containing protein [Massilia sp. YIM B02787]MVW64572.1 hypothetical protein [Telluria cellulosilytica]
MNDEARQLRQLLKIGMARAGRPPAGLPAPLDALLPHDAAAAPEGALWLSLGALDLWERSGFIAPDQPAPAFVPASAPDTLRPCPPRAQAVLTLLLRDLHPAGLEAEWLRLLHRYGGHLPAHMLPKLLDAATRQPALRPALLPVLGERGHWLARVQAEWNWAADIDAEAAPWDTGTPEQRVAALRDWRARDPQAALAALAAAWSSEPPDQRAALLAALAVGLGPDDEAFLEAALDDRRKEVRIAAQRLLARLPGSRLAQRMEGRLLPLLRIESDRIELTLPAALDAAMRRDGIGAAPHHGLGEKAGWVVDMLAAADPHVWTRQFDRTPRACLELAGHSEFAAVFVRGWALAVQRQDGARAWLLDFLIWSAGARPSLREAVPDSLFDVAAAHIAQDDALFDALAGKWIGDGFPMRLLTRLAAGAPHAWSEDMSRRALERLRTSMLPLPDMGHPWLVRQMLSSLALALDPATTVASEAGLRAAWQPDAEWDNAVNAFFDLARLRHEMTLSFQEPA